MKETVHVVLCDCDDTVAKSRVPSKCCSIVAPDTLSKLFDLWSILIYYYYYIMLGLTVLISWTAVEKNTVNLTCPTQPSRPLPMFKPARDASTMSEPMDYVDRCHHSPTLWTCFFPLQYTKGNISTSLQNLWPCEPATLAEDLEL